MSTVRIQATPLLPKHLFKGYSGIAVLVDQNTRRHCYGKIKAQLPGHTVIEVPAGEQHKNLDTCQLVWQQFTAAGLDRHSLLIIIGGGVLGDLGGFCASTYKRGIVFLQVPTTLLAMADASIGGKTGVDFGSLKNHIGTFSLPVATWIATDFLKSLPVRELRSGFAEIIKHALISDRRLWNTIKSAPLEGQDWLRLVRHSAKFKAGIVRKDPVEKGLRKILNYGHTVGHAVESHFLTKGNPILHGEAIAAGMIVEAHIAFSGKRLSRSELDEIAGYILQVFGKINLPADEEIIPTMRQDKKNKGNVILMALPKTIGKAAFDIPVSEHSIKSACAFYRAFQT
jgi:3-dehydroquinate synthase